MPEKNESVISRLLKLVMLPVTLLFTPMSITLLIGMEDARFVLNVSRPSP